MADAVFRAESGIYSGANSTFAANVAVTGNLTANSNVVFSSTTVSTSTTSGALVVTGGHAVGGNLFVGGNTTVGGNIATSGTIVSRVTSVADSNTITPNISTTDIVYQVNLSQTAGNVLTIAAPTGTPIDGQKFMIKIKSANVLNLTNWNAAYAFSNDLPQPTATTGSNKTDYVGFIYDSTATKWQMIAKNFGF